MPHLKFRIHLAAIDKNLVTSQVTIIFDLFFRPDMNTSIADEECIDSPRITRLPTIADDRGMLTYIQHPDSLPFDIAEVQWSDLSHQAFESTSRIDVPEALIAIAGSISVNPSGVTLQSTDVALILPPLSQRTIVPADSSTVILRLLSSSHTSSQVTPCSAPSAESSSLSHCRIISLSQNDSGLFSTSSHLPFKIRRVFYISQIPTNLSRGHHSHDEMQEILVACRGSFSVTLNDGHNSRTFILDHPAKALYIPAGIWRTLHDFSPDSICLAAASTAYSPDDYETDFQKFIQKKI